jgi:hypothetical protein
MRPYVVWRTKLLTRMLVALAILVFPLLAATQQPGHIPRIAFLDVNYPPAAAESTPLVAYLLGADKYLGPLASHLSGVSQPVISTRSVFSTLLPSLLADI